MYAEGVQAAGRLGGAGHLKLAGWRETGALLGVCAAAVAPTLLEATGRPYAGFAVAFAIPVPRGACCSCVANGAVARRTRRRASGPSCPMA